MRIQTPEAILSYPNLYEPRAVNEGDEAKYSCTFIFPKGTDISVLKDAVVEVARREFGDKADAMLQDGSLRIPFRTDVSAKGYPEGSVFINCRSKRQPGVVAAYADPATGKPKVIDDPNVAFPGAIVRGLISCYAYKRPSKGITFGLEGVQVLRTTGDDVVRLDGRVAAEDAFEADPNATPADFADLPGAVEDEQPAESTDDAEDTQETAPAAAGTASDPLASLMP